jgi:hypothetical protein
MRAVRLFKDEMVDCETAIVTVFNDLLNLSALDEFEPKNRRIGLGFQVPCGAVLGAIRVINNYLDPPNDTAKLSRELTLAFARKHKATTCQYLTAHVKWGEHHRHCGKYVYTAAELLWNILEPITRDG